MRPKCLVCGAENAIASVKHFEMFSFECPVCGKYTAAHELVEDGLDKEAAPLDKRFLLQAWIKWRELEESDPPRLTDRTCAEVIAAIPAYTPTEKMQQLLLGYAALCKRPGQTIPYTHHLDYPYAYAINEREGNEYFTWLLDNNLVLDEGNVLRLTKTGWDFGREVSLKIVRMFQRDRRQARRQA